MAKARRMIRENAALVDAVCEVADARIPRSSRNPEVPELTGGKPRLVILNRADQADAAMTDRWAAYFKKCGAASIRTDAKSGKGTGALQAAVRELLKEKIAYYASRGQSGRLLRVMIVGIPNVGKSSLINRVAGRKAAETSDRPGVTRGKQWIAIGGGIEMLDTPGLLWPKFEDPEVGEHLAFTGAVRDDILDLEALSSRLMALMAERYPAALAARYGIDPQAGDGFGLLTLAAKKRGFIVSGGEPDTERMAKTLLDEFRGGKLGRLTLETPPES